MTTKFTSAQIEPNERGRGEEVGRRSAAANHAAVAVRRAALQAELERIVRVMVEQYDPECIIFYGSFAHGDIHAWSNLDLCVIKQTEKRFIERLEEVGLLTLPRVGCQILVYTPKALKAFLFYNGQTPPRIHELPDLRTRCLTFDTTLNAFRAECTTLKAVLCSDALP